MRQLGQEHGGLQRIEARVVADLVVVILLGPTVQAKPREPLAERLVVGQHHAAIAPGTKVLGREERQRGHGAELAGVPPGAIHEATRADGLGTILDDGQTMPLGDRDDPLHRRHLPEEVHHHDRAGARRDRGLDGLWRDVERHRIDVGEDRNAAGIVDCPGRRKEGERRGDHLVARLQVERADREQQRIGAAGAADAPAHPRHGGNRLFERRHLRAHDEGLTIDHGLHGGLHFVADGLVLGNEVKHRNRHL